jgi:ABC-2 type transport system permease protein
LTRIWTILKREYLENVRTRAFVIGLVMTPVWIGLIFAITAVHSELDQHDVIIVDETGLFAEKVKATLEGMSSDAGVEPEASEARGAERAIYRVRIERAEDVFDGSPRLEQLKQGAGSGRAIVVVLTMPLLEKRPPAEGEHASEIFAAGSLSQAGGGETVRAVVNTVVTEHVLQQRRVDPGTAALIARPAIPRVTGLDAEGADARASQAILPFVLIMLLYMGIMGVSQMLVSSTLEEKSNRVYEVLLSSVSPFDLMAGKILGICCVGLTLLAIWSTAGFLAIAGDGGESIVSGAQAAWFLLYYLLGFLMIGSLMVAVGSACNTIKEAQNMMAPLSMILILPLVISILSLQNPNGPLATFASFIPPFTPFMMVARMAGAPGPPDWQVWVTLLLLVLSTYAAIGLAARVFRVGILLYGQPPGFKQILRWARAGD